jgi:hypothetical protein
LLVLIKPAGKSTTLKYEWSWMIRGRHKQLSIIKLDPQDHDHTL